MLKHRACHRRDQKERQRLSKSAFLNFGVQGVGLSSCVDRNHHNIVPLPYAHRTTQDDHFQNADTRKRLICGILFQC